MLWELTKTSGNLDSEFMAAAGLTPIRQSCRGIH